MPTSAYNLAFETAGRGGGVALGRDDAVIAAAPLSGAGRERADLMAVVQRLCADHAVSPAQLGGVYLDLGPGSFTGLRLAVAAARMLALTLGVQLVGVEGLDVLAANVTDHLAGKAAGGRLPGELPGGGDCFAVGAAVKRGTLYSAVYQPTAQGPRRTAAPALRSLAELLALTPAPAALLAAKLPAGADVPPGVAVLDPALAEGRAEVVHALGRSRAARGQFTGAHALAPIYAREPEAVTLWRQKSQRSSERQRDSGKNEPRRNAEERGSE